MAEATQLYDVDAMFASIMAFWLMSVVLMIATMALFLLNYCQKDRRVSITYKSPIDSAYINPYTTGGGPEMKETSDQIVPEYSYMYPEGEDRNLPPRPMTDL